MAARWFRRAAFLCRCAVAVFGAQWCCALGRKTVVRVRAAAFVVGSAVLWVLVWFGGDRIKI